MLMNANRLWRAVCAVAALVIAVPSLAQPAPQAQPLVTVTPRHVSGIYEVGDHVGWTVALNPNATTPAPAGTFTYTVRRDNFDVVKTGELDLASGKADIDVPADAPSMLYVTIAPPPAPAPAAEPGVAPAPGAGRGRGRGNGIPAIGAAIAPTKIVPSAPRPADFDAFWDAKIKMLQAIPANPVLTPGDSGKPDVEFATIRMDHVNGTHVYGQIAKPKAAGKYPAVLILQWASPPYPLQKSWVTDRAAEGWLALNIEPHDVLPDQPADYYAALPQEIKNYASIGQEDRDKSYFLQMYLADYRAVEYLGSRPDWDGKTLVVMGTSMGGQQSLAVAGLNSRITHVIVNEPAGADMTGQLHHRQAGYPNFPPTNTAVMMAAPYFDTVNFASHITAPSLVAMGFVDTTAPPVGIWAAFNQIKGPKEAAPMIESPHNNLATPAQQRPYTARSAEWLATLVKTGKIAPDETKVKP